MAKFLGQGLAGLATSTILSGGGLSIMAAYKDTFPMRHDRHWDSDSLP